VRVARPPPLPEAAACLRAPPLAGTAISRARLASYASHLAAPRTLSPSRRVRPLGLLEKPAHKQKQERERQEQNREIKSKLLSQYATNQNEISTKGSQQLDLTDPQRNCEKIK